MKRLLIDKSVNFSNATIGISRSRWGNFPVLHDTASRKNAKEVARQIKVVADYVEVSAVFWQTGPSENTKNNKRAANNCTAAWHEEETRCKMAGRCLSFLRFTVWCPLLMAGQHGQNKHKRKQDKEQ